MIYQYLKRLYTLSQQENDHREIAHYMSKGETILNFSVAFSHNITVSIHTLYTVGPLKAKLSGTSVDGGTEQPAIGMHACSY